MLRRDRTVLVVIDVQERLLPFIHEHDALLSQIVRLVRGFRILGLPILVTEQYRKGLGPTDPRIVEALTEERSTSGPVAGAEEGRRPAAAPIAGGGPEFTPIEKMAFSCAAHPPFLEALERSGRSQVLLCGIESHVCVLQTALDLAARGLEVHLAADAVSSRSPRNVEIALRRMEQSGVVLGSVEMSVFEMLCVSGTPEFKEWSRVIR